MGNVVTLNGNTPVSESLHMSNGLTSTFIDVFGLSGSRLATNDIEKRLIVWVLEKDQSAVGIGTVGFEICDMPWELDCFEDNRKFIISVLEGMKSRLGWETLNYLVNEELLFPRIEQFKNLLLKMTAKDINLAEIKWWLEEPSDNDPLLNRFPKCPKHEVLLSIHGCHVCAN